jgi:uncharacterized protein (TIGR02271 family)
MDRRGVREGLTVRSADGDKLGKVVMCDADTFIVEKGIFFPRERAIRYDDVQQVSDGELWLSWGRAALERDGEAGEERRIPLVEEELSAEKRMAEGGEVEIKKDVVTEHKTIDVPLTREEVRVERVPVDAKPASDASFASDTIRVPIKEEIAEVHKRPVVREEVRVQKTAETQTQKLDAETKREVAEVKGRGNVKRVDKHPPR